MRFVRFSAVGMLGAAVQLAVLYLGTRVLGIPYVAATVIAVEIALLHNFGWHEMWTWKNLPWRGWPVRLMRFQLSNGAISVASNAALTFVFHEFARLPVLAANVAAMTITALVNFHLGKRWVFRGVLIAMLLGVRSDAAVFTTKLQPGTVAAWNDYVGHFEGESPEGRPMMDAGQMLPVDLNPTGGNVPDGYIHHWIGGILIPNVSVAQVCRVLGDYGRWQQIYSPDVRFASATRMAQDTYDLRMISEQADGLLHFAFDMHFRVQFRQVGDFQLAEVAVVFDSGTRKRQRPGAIHGPFA